MRLYTPAQTTGDKIAQLMLIPAGLRSTSTPRTRMTSHLRWILCSAIAVGLWVELNKRQNMVTELCEANTNLADELHRAEGYNFWDGVAAGESLHRN